MAIDVKAGIVGCVLAGGLGRRLGGDKAVVSVNGHALADYPLAALREAGLAELALVVKRDTVLPELPDSVGIWVEPDEPRHPLTGIVHALRTARGRPVLVVAADMALIDASTLLRIEGAFKRRDHAVVPHADGRLQPLCALYAPSALRTLERFTTSTRVIEAVMSLQPRVVEFSDPRPFFNVNGPEDVLQAGTLLREKLAPR